MISNYTSTFTCKIIGLLKMRNYNENFASLLKKYPNYFQRCTESVMIIKINYNCYNFVVGLLWISDRKGKWKYFSHWRLSLYMTYADYVFQTNKYKNSNQLFQSNVIILTLNHLIYPSVLSLMMMHDNSIRLFLSVFSFERIEKQEIL